MKKQIIGLILSVGLFLGACTSVVTVELPDILSNDFGFVTEEYLETYAESQEMNDKGEKVVKFKEDKYKDFTDDFKNKLESYLEELEKSDELEISKIEYDKDFKNVTIYIDRESLQEEYSPVVIGMYTSIYRAYLKEDPNFNLNIKDRENNEDLGSAVFPGIE